MFPGGEYKLPGYPAYDPNGSYHPIRSYPPRVPGLGKVIVVPLIGLGLEDPPLELKDTWLEAATVNGTDTVADPTVDPSPLNVAVAV
jgi:hypothetical protein